MGYVSLHCTQMNSVIKAAKSAMYYKFEIE